MRPELVAGDPTPLESAMRRLSEASDIHTWTTPIELTQHRARLAECVEQGRIDYPEPFAYAGFDTDALVAASDEVTSLACSIAQDALRTAVVATASNARRRAEAASSADDAVWAATCRELDGLPLTQVVSAATEIVSDSRPSAPLRPPSVPTALLESGVRSALRGYGLGGWDVVIESSMAAGMSVVGSERRIQIREGLKVTQHQMARLIVHEVGGHVLRWESSWAQDCALAAYPLLDSIPTEEGLAVSLEEELGVAEEAQVRLYALRVLAVLWAQDHGIVQLVERLKERVPLPTAIELAIRVKRGLRDPNSPGGMTKDHGYLSGLLELRTHSARDLAALRVTKWPVHLLPVIYDLIGLGELDPSRGMEATLEGLCVDPSWLE